MIQIGCHRQSHTCVCVCVCVCVCDIEGHNWNTPQKFYLSALNGDLDLQQSDSKMNGIGCDVFGGSRISFWKRTARKVKVTQSPILAVFQCSICKGCTKLSASHLSSTTLICRRSSTKTLILTASAAFPRCMPLLTSSPTPTSSMLSKGSEGSRPCCL